jgi:trigger factor
VKSSVTTLEDNKVKVSVEVDEGEIDEAIDQAFRKIAKEVRLPGFRPGKAPRRVLEARLGKEYARGEALNEAIPEYYRKAIIEHDVDVIAPPDLDLTSGQDDGPVVFEAVVEVRPTITVAGYEGLRVEIGSPWATDDEIDEQVDALRSQAAERREIDRPAIDGDFVTMDIAGFEDDEPVDGLTSDEYTYEVGSGFIVDTIDDELRGSKIGDIREFEGPHPNEDDVTLSFRVLVKKIEEKVLPELTDELVGEISEFETAEELVADTRRRIEAMKRSAGRAAIADKTAEALAELVTVEIPAPLVDDQVQRQLQDMAMRLASQGVQLEQFLEMTGQDMSSFVEGLREPAERSAKVDLALRAVAAAEGIELTDDELQAELDRMGPQFGEDGAALRTALEEGGQLSSMRADIVKQKAMDLLLETVTIVDFEGNPVDRSDLDEPDADEDGEPSDDSADEADPATASGADDPDTSAALAADTDAGEPVGAGDQASDAAEDEDEDDSTAQGDDQ